MSEHLDGARKAIEDRLSDLRDEIKRLETAAEALGGAIRRRGPGRPRKSAGRPAKRASARRATSTRRAASTRRATATGTRRRGRPKGSGTRALQAQKLVAENPGITIADLAKRMKIKPNYLYRVMPQLQKDGKIRKQGSGWHAK